MSETWTTLRVLDWTTSRFERAGIESARLEAQILLAHVLQCDRVALYTAFERPLTAEELAGFRGLIQRRLTGQSVAYVVGTKEFWSREFAVNEHVLVPRADTETLISLALDQEKSAPQGFIVDIGTGSGAIAITLAAELLEREVIAIDVSGEALDVARRNAQTHGVAERVTFRQGDLSAPIGDDPVAMIVANLPYVASAEIDGLDAEVRAEPRLALDGGEHGLDLIERLCSEAAARLVAGGCLVLEHGEEQGQAVRKLLMTSGAFQDVETVKDLAGRDRVTWGRRIKT